MLPTQTHRTSKVPWRIRPRSRFARRAPSVIAGLAGIGAITAGASPSGLAAADLILSFGFAALVSLAAGRSRRWTWLVVAGTAAVFAGSTWALWLGLFALGVAFLAVTGDWRMPIVGALVGGCSVVALLGV